MTLLNDEFPKCANCKIVLLQHCARSPLSNNVWHNSTTCENLTFYNVLTNVFKLKKSVLNGSSVQDLELCRYCTNNFTQLARAYQTILKIANESDGAVFSKMIVQSKGKPGRPRKNTVDEVIAQELAKNVDILMDHDDSDPEEAPFGLQYLGLTRKRPVTLGSSDDLGQSERLRRETKSLMDIDLLGMFTPEINLICELEGMRQSPSHQSCSQSNYFMDDKIKDPDFPADFEKVPCRYCDKTFRHPERLQKHLEAHHESITKEDEAHVKHNVVSSIPRERSSKRIAKSKLNSVKPAGKKRGRPPKENGDDENAPVVPKLKISLKVPRASIQKSNLKVTGDKASTKPVKEYSCHTCTKKFKNPHLLKKHKRSHSNDHRCSDCGKKFKDPHLLSRHMQLHENKNPDEGFKCDQCSRIFPNVLGLQVHYASHSRTMFTCRGCKRKFKIEKNYAQHLETARCTEKKHPCPQCGKLFKNKDKVKRHQISMHAEIKPFTCELCSKGFRSLADLKLHEVNAHICGDLKEYQCDQCGKRFKSFDTLKSHESYSHKMEKKHFCSICGKGFPLLATLKVHEVSHRTERPFMCTFCGKTYKHASDLKNHEVVHYKDEEKPFMCPICNKRYHRKDVLRLHQTREKHYGPDIPVPQLPKKPRIWNPTKSTKRNGTKLALDASNPAQIVEATLDDLVADATGTDDNDFSSFDDSNLSNNSSCRTGDDMVNQPQQHVSSSSGLSLIDYHDRINSLLLPSTLVTIKDQNLPSGSPSTLSLGTNQRNASSSDSNDALVSTPTFPASTVNEVLFEYAKINNPDYFYPFNSGIDNYSQL